MAISKKILVQTEFGQAQLFCNNERSIYVRISREDSGANLSIRGHEYYVSVLFKKEDASFGFKEWKVNTPLTSIYRSGSKSAVSPSTKEKIESSLLAFVKSWVLTPEGEKLLRETEVQDRLEAVLRLTEEEKELESQLTKLKGKIAEAISHWEAAKKEYGIE